MTTRTRIALCCACFIASAATVRALDLTPHPITKQGNEGPAVQMIAVSDGTSKFAFLPPPKWLVDGAPTTIGMSSGDSRHGWIKLFVVEKKDDAHPPDDQSKPEDIEKWATAFIPGASAVKFVKSVSSPFMVNGRSSTEYQFTYAAYGQRAPISVSIVDFNATQELIVMVSSNEESFEQIRLQAIASMFSWQLQK